MKTKIYSFYSRLISFGLVLLGFAACSSDNDDEREEPRVEYGTPSASYKVNGKVITSDAEKKPIKNIRVVMIEDVDETKVPYIKGDTVFTNNEGKFEIKSSYFASNKVKVKLQDVNGEDNSLFEEKIEKIEFKSSDFKGGSGWYRGEAQKDLGTIEMSLKEKSE